MSTPPDAPMLLRMLDRRALVGLASGLAGLAFGVAAVVLTLPVLAVAAAAAALLAGAASLLLVQRLQVAEHEAAGAAALIKLLDLPQPARADARSLLDAETGLADARYFDLAVDGRVAAARRHLWPVTVVIIEIGLDAGTDTPRQRAEAVRTFAALCRTTLRESDIATRIGPLSFGLVLEDTAEEGGVWTAERLQIAVAQEAPALRRVAAGVASYPTHALQADEVLTRARAALTRACATASGLGLGQVEVAKADLA